MPRIIATLLLLFLFTFTVASSASATSIINDDGDANKVQASSAATAPTTSNLIDVIMQKRNSFTLTTHALQTLREERIFGGLDAEHEHSTSG